MALATDGSDYDTYAPGSANYLSQLRLWVSVLRTAIKKGSYSVEGRSWGPGAIEVELARAKRDLELAASSGTFFRGVPLR